MTPEGVIWQAAPILGMDLGGTKIAAILVDAADEPIASISVPTDGRPLGEQLVDAARRALDKAGAEYRPAAIGIGAPGQVDSEAGVLRLAVNLAAADVPITSIVEGALGIPCFLEHDAHAAAAWLDGRRPTGSLAYLSVGTGISAAVVIDGRPLRGARGMAGEIGHLVAVENGPICACGLQGCLEAVAAGPAIARQASARIAAGEATSLPANADARAVYQAAAGGDQLALSIAESVGRYLARAIRGVVLAYGVERVVIGGGLSRAGAPFLDPILRELDRERQSSRLALQALPRDLIELLPPDTDAGARGAVVIARSGLRAAARHRGQREVDDG
jgi:glucokinase